MARQKAIIIASFRMRVAYLHLDQNVNALLYSKFRMGSEPSQCLAFSAPQDQPFSSHTPHPQRPSLLELPELEEQQSDNPSRQLLGRAFLQTTVTASHSILQLPPKEKPPAKPTLTHISIFRVDSEDVGSVSKSISGGFDETSEKQEDGEEEIRPRRASIEALIPLTTQQTKESIDIDPSLLKPLSDFILSQQRLFAPANIAKENFVRFRCEDVHLSYEFGEKLGQGGFGVVFRAVCRHSGAVRAAKLLKRAKLTQQELLKIEKEVDLLRRLDHPNILKVYEAYLHEGHYCIITELCEGGSLLNLARQGKKLGQRAIKIIFRKLMSALSYLHELGIVHRDIKLDNIVLVRRSGGAGSWDIRLIDFGLAKQLTTRRVRDKVKIGTYTYMAPEVLRGIYSTKCDLWSSGVVLCSLIIGSNPFKKSTKQSTFESILKYNIKFDGQNWSTVSMEAKDLLLKLLAKDLSKRISAVEALAHPFLRATREFQLEKPIFEKVIKKLTDYNRGNNLVSLIESYLSYTATTPTDLQQLSEEFQALDLNCDGFIERSELQEAFMRSGCRIAEAELRYVLGKVDKNQSGRIDYSQFVAALTDRSKLFTENSLISAFRYFDANSSGFLEREQLRQALKLAEGKELDFLLGELDKNNDDKISQTEFVRYLADEQYN